MPSATTERLLADIVRAVGRDGQQDGPDSYVWQPDAADRVTLKVLDREDVCVELRISTEGEASSFQRRYVLEEGESKLTSRLTDGSPLPYDRLVEAVSNMVKTCFVGS